LARENSALSRKLTSLQDSSQKALPAPEEALIWDETIYDDTEDGPALEIG
jgi:hypothetical protein